MPRLLKNHRREESPTGRVVEKEKEIHSNFAVTFQTVKVMGRMHGMCLAPMEEAFTYK